MLPLRGRYGQVFRLEPDNCKEYPAVLVPRAVVVLDLEVFGQ